MTVSELCPLCAAAIGEPKTVRVCKHCHTGLQGSPRAMLSTTGEFPAMADPTLDSPSPITRAPNPDGQAASTCCLCNKSAGEVRKLLSQGSYHICNECVSLCADVLRMELGDDFG